MDSTGPSAKRSKGGGGRCPDCNDTFTRHADLERHFRQATWKGEPKDHACMGLRRRGCTFDDFVALTRGAQYMAKSKGGRGSAGGAGSSWNATASSDNVRTLTNSAPAAAAESYSEGRMLGVHGGKIGTDDRADKLASEDEMAIEEEEVGDGYESKSEFLALADIDDDPPASSDLHGAFVHDEDVGGPPAANNESPEQEYDVPEHVTHTSDGGKEDKAACGLPASVPHKDPEGLLPNKDDPIWLHNIHRSLGERLGGSIVEGGDGNVKQRQFGKRNQDYRPFADLSTLLLMVFGVKHGISQVAMTDLFQILRYVDGVPGDGAGEGRAFNTAEVPRSGTHFLARMREYPPLFEIWVRKVYTKPSNIKRNPGAPTAVNVYDIPLSHVLAFLLKSKFSMEEMLANPGGVVVSGEQAQGIRLASEHITPLPTVPTYGRRRNVMHGTLVRGMPHLNTDGFLSAANTRCYVGDLVMCDLRDLGDPNPRQVPCRILRSVFDEEKRILVVVVRCFRNANEVLGLAYDHPNYVVDDTSLVRVWEELGAKFEVVLREASQVLDLIEVFNRDDVRKGLHRCQWRGEGQRREGWSFCGEGFVERRGQHNLQRIRNRYGQGWRRAGGEEENYPDMRRPEINHNYLNLKYFSLLFGIWVDDFNVWSMTNPVRVAINFVDFTMRMVKTA